MMAFFQQKQGHTGMLKVIHLPCSCIKQKIKK
nr:MAG TPA: hypothetical protein [Caudoviricetes sp.]